MIAANEVILHANPDSRRRLYDCCSYQCPNCSCLHEDFKYCEGCERTLCANCWAEHNEDAECHVQQA